MDTMTPTTSVFGNAKEYDTQGQITQELRILSRIHGIPVISPTQNQRDSEDVTKLMTNKLIGDSYKKIRYSDFIYMLRMREDKNFLSEGVREQVVIKKQASEGVIPDAVSPEILSIKDRLYDTLVPLEVKITKSKDSEKNKSRFFLFCKENLRIYNNIDEYIKDAPMIKIHSDRLDSDVNKMMNHAIAHVITSDFSEPSTEEAQVFEPINDFPSNDIFQSEPIDGIFH